jgi:hypothetical protein
MINKVLTGFVVAFWVVMMAALARMELFPSATNLTIVPVGRVLRKVFESGEPQSLKVIYQDHEIGLATIEFTPLASPASKPSEPFSGEPGGYYLKAGLTLDLNVFGTPSRFHLNTDSRFDTRYEIRDYRIRTMVGASQVEINGHSDARTVTMTYDIGEGPRQKELNYDQLTSPGALNDLGLPALSGIAGLALPANSTSPLNDAAGLRPIVRAYDDRLIIGGISQHAYLLDCRSEANPGYWMKLWIDEQGTILVVQTSIGISLHASAIDGVADPITAATTTTTHTRTLK